MKKVLCYMMVLATLLLATGCSEESAVVSENISKAAHMFQIVRRVVFFNGITDKYMLSIEGLCTVTNVGNQLDVTCKTGENEYKKHYLGLSDNVTYFVEQLDAADVSAYRYKVIFRPTYIIPDVDYNTYKEN